MSYITTVVKRAGWIVPAVVCGVTLGCMTSPDEGRLLPPSTVVIELPEHLGHARRPAVEFPHGKHTTELEEEGCGVCHLSNDDDELVFRFNRLEEPSDRDAFMNVYHDACMGCHGEVASNDTPEACSDCHAALPEGELIRLPMRYDYSLHARHADPGESEEELCRNCHHTVNEETGALEYIEGQESGCGGSGCHGDEDVGNNLSLANASHHDCVNCHLREIEEEEDAGPVLCVGCHDAEARAGIEPLADEEIPRIDRDQPDMAWVRAEGGEIRVVAFNHEEHEGNADFCSGCHHNTLAACSDCHTLMGSEDGGGVTLQTAFHDSDVEQSCVGCHQQQTAEADCAGCHVRINRTPRKRSCNSCHDGPYPDDPMLEIPPLARLDVTLDPLPESSDDAFPEEIVIDILAETYEASRFPHRKIVEHLYESIQESELAMHFHGTTELLCSGCHHQTPEGVRPPSCSSCHTLEGNPRVDVPSLRAAFHRQCVGCHQQMGIEKQGCTDCHEEAGREGDQ